MNRNDFDFSEKNADMQKDLFYTSYTAEDNSAYTTKEYERDYRRAIEVPLPDKPKLSVVITIIGCVLFLGFMFCFIAAGGQNSIYSGLIVQFIGMVLFAALTICAPFIDRYCLKKVCTVWTEGTYAGYDTRIRSSKYGTYNIYAPKYEMFINGHYEIRTLDDFSRSLDFAAKMDLLANPDGYEIMPADGSISHSGKRNIIKVLIVLALIMIIAMPFIVKRIF